MNMKKIYALLLSIAAFGIAAKEAPPIVQIDSGQLQGAYEYNMQAFKNIPYAAPPVGDLRWRPPQPAANGRAFVMPLLLVILVLSLM